MLISKEDEERRKNRGEATKPQEKGVFIYYKRDKQAEIDTLDRLQADKEQQIKHKRHSTSFSH